MPYALQLSVQFTCSKLIETISHFKQYPLQQSFQPAVRRADATLQITFSHYENGQNLYKYQKLDLKSSTLVLYV